MRFRAVALAPASILSVPKLPVDGPRTMELLTVLFTVSSPGAKMVTVPLPVGPPRVRFEPYRCWL